MSLEQKISSLTKYMDDLAHDLADTRNRVKSLEDWQQALAQAIIAAPQKPQAEQEAFDQFPEAVRKYIQKVTVEGNHWNVKMQYVSPEKFKELSAELKALGGSFVSAGKDSHWKVPMK